MQEEPGIVSPVTLDPTQASLQGVHIDSLSNESAHHDLPDRRHAEKLKFYFENVRFVEEIITENEQLKLRLRELSDVSSFMHPPSLPSVW
jgi:hypothetical protein